MMPSRFAPMMASLGFKGSQHRGQLSNLSRLRASRIKKVFKQIDFKVLQEGEFERLGIAKTIKVDVRVIAATAIWLRRFGTKIWQNFG